MKKLTISLLAAALIISGCGTEEETRERTSERTQESVYEVQHRMNNGDTIRCIAFSQPYRGGLSCDWENPR